MFKCSFQTNTQVSRLILPYELPELFSAFEDVRRDMIRNKLEIFSRDEWAYLLSFLSKDNLQNFFLNAFGSLQAQSSNSFDKIYRPRGTTVIWLPNNVSMLGPLSYIMALISGCRVVLKTGSSGANLTTPFFEYLTWKIRDPKILEFIVSHTKIETASRGDPLLEQLSSEADVRVFFGSDESWKNVSSLKKKGTCVDIPFTDHVSEIWLEMSEITDNLIKTIANVFGIYGQAGCTSPKKIVILGGAESDANDLRDKILNQWNVRNASLTTEAHVASQNVLAHQRSLALGYDSLLATHNSATFASGSSDSPHFTSYYLLPIIHGTLDWASSQVPHNIQTLGLACSRETRETIIDAITRTNVKRIVSIDKMHHFGNIWDGYEYWRSFFECIEVNL